MNSVHGRLRKEAEYEKALPACDSEEEAETDTSAAASALFQTGSLYGGSAVPDLPGSDVCREPLCSLAGV